MAVKKAVAKKAAAKKPAVKKASAKGKTKVGDVYGCRVCGLAVSVDEACGCVETCDIICCDVPMKVKRA